MEKAPVDPANQPPLAGDPGHPRLGDELLHVVAGFMERVARLTSDRDRDEVLTHVVDACIRHTGSERGLLVLESGKKDVEVRIARQRGGMPVPEELQISSARIRRILALGQPLLELADAEEVGLAATVFSMNLRSVMCVPFRWGEGSDSVRGALYVDSSSHSLTFSEKDLAFFSALARAVEQSFRFVKAHFDALERARLEASLETAREVQTKLLPRRSAQVAGYDLHGWLAPADRASGDFYDFFEARDGKLAAVVGDVTGHGPAAALITASAQAGLRAVLRLVPDVGEAVEIVNRDLHQRIEPGKFVTLVVCVLSPDGTVEVRNAGHPPPLVWRDATGSVERVAEHGTCLGIFEEIARPPRVTVRLARGDALLAYTDGITEAHPKGAYRRMLGEEELARLFAAEAAVTAEASLLTERLAASVLERTGQHCEDDMTMIALRRTAH